MVFRSSTRILSRCGGFGVLINGLVYLHTAKPFLRRKTDQMIKAWDAPHMFADLTPLKNLIQSDTTGISRVRTVTIEAECFAPTLRGRLPRWPFGFREKDMEAWDEAKLQTLIDNFVEESLILEYKSAGSFALTDSKRKEITKDVSAMANSAGGTIIYGLKEYTEPDKKHLAESIDPIHRTPFSKEWLEQIINNIRPHIDNV